MGSPERGGGGLRAADHGLCLGGNDRPPGCERPGQDYLLFPDIDTASPTLAQLPKQKISDEPWATICPLVPCLVDNCLDTCICFCCFFPQEAKPSRTLLSELLWNHFRSRTTRCVRMFLLISGRVHPGPGCHQ